jgi:hypothetical protein
MWTGIFAYNTTTGQLYRNCVALRNAETDASRVASLFGSECGVSPAWFDAIPTTVCNENPSGELLLSSPTAIWKVT